MPSESPVLAYVSLGSNQGDSVVNLEKARSAMNAFPGVRLTRESSLYITEPVELADQPFFINQVVELSCVPAVRPDVLLDMMLATEASLGRVREDALRYGPRPLDLDLLLFGNARMDTHHLVLPHPRMLQRAFVLVPLAEIRPDLVLPQGGTVQEALSRIRFRQEGDTIFQK